MAKKYCTNCGYQGHPKRVVKGSTLVELILFILFIIPGILYGLWRLASASQACPKCGAPHMIPLNSPKAQESLRPRQVPSTESWITTEADYEGTIDPPKKLDQSPWQKDPSGRFVIPES